jgi:NhaP-type Na+/H+ or K+/H+ antiporter
LANDIWCPPRQFGLFSLLIKERLYIGEAVVSVVVGIALGPYAIDLLNPHHWGGEHEQNNELVNEITLEITRVVIAIGVFAIGVELPKAYLKKHWKSLAMLLGPAMVVSDTFAGGS